MHERDAYLKNALWDVAHSKAGSDKNESAPCSPANMLRMVMGEMSADAFWKELKDKLDIQFEEEPC